MEIRKLTPTVGCEVSGIDLSRPLDAPTIEKLKNAFVEHGVLIMRGQHLDERQFIDFARGFGPLESYESTLSQYLMPQHPDILVLSNMMENGRQVGVQDAGQYWHTDRSYVAQPAWSSVLHAKRIPHDENGKPLGGTLFSSMVGAVDMLDGELRKKLEKLSVLHEYVFRFSKPNDSMPAATHPLILEHPLTKKPCLYVNAGFTKKILGMAEEESKALLESLYAHITSESLVYRHEWQEGDLLMWDNYSTQHRAVNDYKPGQDRLMWRTTIQGFPLG